MNSIQFPFNTYEGTAPFSKIVNKDFIPSIKDAIKEAKEEIHKIVHSSEEPTFENTIEALEHSGEKLERISSILFNLHSAETNDEIDEITQEVSPLLSAFGNDVQLNPGLFQKVKTVHDKKDNLNLSSEERMLLEKSYKSFVRNGALLQENQKERLREIDKDLSLLSLQFSKNVLADQNAYQLHIEDVIRLDGLPKDELENAAELAKSKNKIGYIFTLDVPVYLPFMKYVKDRELRKELAIAYGKKGFQNNENNNEEVILKIVHLRHQRANLLGYPSHAHFVLEERMAESPQKVNEFLEDLREKALPAARKDLEMLTAFANNKDGIENLEKWDSAYYSNLLKDELFSLDDEKLKPYFQLENVLNGAFEVANRLYGLSFEEIHNIDKYHEEVRTFKVTDQDGKLKAIFYTDFFPRKGKRNGAWMTSYKDQAIRNGVNDRPHVSIVCNFTRPTATKPSLLTFNEVTTLFHEFGHALHGINANTKYSSLSGTSVSWDFVELPSQMLENWCYEKETLELFAKHYETGEMIPMEYIEKIKESANFLEGLATVRQLSFGILDMGWHAQDPSHITNVKAFEKEMFASTQIFPDVEENMMSTAFGHIFSGGYSAGYYSYKWSEVLDADAFAYFKENGIFNKEIAQKFLDNVLSKGGTEKPMELYKRFRGQEPTNEALLKRAGLI